MNWIPTHEIDHNGSKSLVALCHGSLITDAEWGAPVDQPAAWHPDWELDEENDLVFQGSTPPGEYSYRKLSEREPHYVVDDERVQRQRRRQGRQPRRVAHRPLARVLDVLRHVVRRERDDQSERDDDDDAEDQALEARLHPRARRYTSRTER